MEVNELMRLIDQAIAVEAERQEIDRRSRAVKKQEDNLKARVIQEMQKKKLDGMGTETGHFASITTTIEPVVADWTKLHAFIRSTGALELLHRRLTINAVKERWESGVEVPGV